jgi:hypothetical protein
MPLEIFPKKYATLPTTLGDIMQAMNMKINPYHFPLLKMNSYTATTIAAKKIIFLNDPDGNQEERSCPAIAAFISFESSLI